jgi:hypothetical protein
MAQDVPQLEARAAGPLADGRGGDAEPLACLVGGQLLDVPRQQGRPGRLVELGEGPAHPRGLLPPIDRLLGGGRII